MGSDPAQSLTHDSWVEALHHIPSDNPDIIDLAEFAAAVLERCGRTPELATYLDKRALTALDRSA